MSISKLFLFAKDTSATATEQGYQYQRLKTLQTWLSNRINRLSDVIYCDYEEDILERDAENAQTVFRQVKLYSTNFSFSKEEIKKTIAHFFMLFVKGDYLFDDVSFLFETNSGIAKEVKGNDADLLLKWYQNQGALTEELLAECRGKVREIVDEYIAETFETLLSADKKYALQQAKVIYSQLTDDVWNKFVLCIGWQFDNLEHDKAIPQLLSNIQLLVPQLPLPLNNGKISDYISVLHFEIAQRTAQSNEEDRKLTPELLDFLILNSGDRDDKWYAAVFAKWLPVENINQFNIGAFYEVISAARHCKQNLYQTNHAKVWIHLLLKYIENKDIITVCRRKAIYEYLWLLLLPNPQTYESKGSIDGQQELIRYYFNQFEERNAISDVEDDIILLQIVEVNALLIPDLMSKAELDQWAKKIEDFIDKTLYNSKDADDYCRSLESKGNFAFHTGALKSLKEKIDSSLQCYQQILPSLKDTKLYSISGLSEQLKQIVKTIITLGFDEDDVTKPLENFIEDVTDEAGKTGKQNDAAKNMVELAVAYLSQPSTKNYLKALDYFYKASFFWYQEETKEGHIIVLINIAKIYSLLGMNLAAKYYGLCAAWASIHFGNQSSFKRISDGYAIVFHSDFVQGAWMSALDDFENYIKARIEFKPEELNIEVDEIFREVILKLSCILTAAPKIQADLTIFIGYYISTLGWLYPKHVQFLTETLEKEFSEDGKFIKTLNNKLDSIPLNDIGKVRTISFNAVGIDWYISFDNTATLNAIAEEFCSLLQITLCEIGLLNTDMHLLQTQVTLIINESGDYSKIVNQQPSHEKASWNLFIPSFDSKEIDKVKYHYGFLALCIKRLLNDLSLLPENEFEETFDNLYKNRKLGDKGLATNTYQKVYFNFLTLDDFDKSKRGEFTLHPISGINLHSPKFLSSFQGLSKKYDKEKSLEQINKRCKNLLSNIHLSLQAWNEDTQFKNTILKFRKIGWLDWQILLAIMNYVLTIKANANLVGKKFESEKQSRQAFEQEFQKMLRINEDECFVQVPVERLQSKEFELFVSKVPVDILASFGLNNNMVYPNFQSVHEYLNKRFEFAKNDVQEDNPLKDL